MKRWTDGLPTRAQLAIAWATESGHIPDLKMVTVRSKSRRWWLRVPGVGKRTIEQIEAAIGPLAPEPTDDELYRVRVKTRDQRAALVRERDRRRVAWHRQNQLDEKHDTQANAFACLIEALTEMRPYLHDGVIGI